MFFSSAVTQPFLQKSTFIFLKETAIPNLMAVTLFMTQVIPSYKQVLNFTPTAILFINKLYNNNNLAEAKILEEQA